MNLKFITEELHVAYFAVSHVVIDNHIAREIDVFVEVVADTAAKFSGVTSDATAGHNERATDRGADTPAASAIVASNAAAEHSESASIVDAAATVF